MGRLICHDDEQNHAGNVDVLVAWPRSGALPERVREENFSADE